MDLENDYYSLTFCAFLKKNIQIDNPNALLSLEEVYEIFFNCLFVFSMQAVLVSLVFYEMTKDGLDFSIVNYEITLSRFICAILLHIQLVGEVE